MATPLVPIEQHARTHEGTHWHTILSAHTLTRARSFLLFRQLMSTCVHSSQISAMQRTHSPQTHPLRASVSGPAPSEHGVLRAIDPDPAPTRAQQDCRLRHPLSWVPRASRQARLAPSEHRSRHAPRRPRSARHVCAGRGGRSMLRPRSMPPGSSCSRTRTARTAVRR